MTQTLFHEENNRGRNCTTIQSGDFLIGHCRQSVLESTTVHIFLSKLLLMFAVYCLLPSRPEIVVTT